MVLLYRRIFFIGIFVILIGCLEDNTLYTFPSLSAGQLVDLKKASETIEGFFLTTDLSDLNVSGTKTGSQIYVCVRFLNDPAVNTKLKKSAIPLLVQVSTDQHVPQAESVVLLHPKTKGVFYYEESQAFNLPTSSFILNSKEYNLLDFHFNKNGKVSKIYFKLKEVPLKDIRQEPGQDIDQYISSIGESSNLLEQEGSNNNDTSPPAGSILKISSFAKLDSIDCSVWSRLRYTHVEEIPEYLQIYYHEKTQKNTSVSTTSVQQKNDPNAAKPGESTTPAVPLTITPPPPINIPSNPAPKPNN